MIYLLLFAAVFAGLGWATWQRSKNDARIYAKIATISLFFISIFFLYQFTYYYQIGQDISKFYNSGAGTTYNATTFLSSSDVQVGEYFALQKANRDVIEIFSGIVPILALLLAGYLLWYYVETGLFTREGDRVS